MSRSYARIDDDGGEVVLVQGVSGRDAYRTPMSPETARALACQLLDAADKAGRVRDLPAPARTIKRLAPGRP